MQFIIFLCNKIQATTTKIPAEDPSWPAQLFQLRPHPTPNGLYVKYNNKFGPWNK